MRVYTMDVTAVVCNICGTIYINIYLYANSKICEADLPGLR